jgi:hypothetical protein
VLVDTEDPDMVETLRGDEEDVEKAVTEKGVVNVERNGSAATKLLLLQTFILFTDERVVGTCTVAMDTLLLTISDAILPLLIQWIQQ